MKLNVSRSWSNHCLATILSRNLSSCPTDASGSILRPHPVRSIRLGSPGPRSSRNRSRRVRICRPPPPHPEAEDPDPAWWS